MYAAHSVTGKAMRRESSTASDPPPPAIVVPGASWTAGRLVTPTFHAPLCAALTLPALAPVPCSATGRGVFITVTGAVPDAWVWFESLTVGAERVRRRGEPRGLVDQDDVTMAFALGPSHLVPHQEDRRSRQNVDED